MFKSIIEWLKNNQKNAPIDVQGWRPEGERLTPESLVKTRKFHRVACGYQPEKEKVTDNKRPDQDKKIEIKSEWRPVVKLNAKRKMQQIPSAPFLDGYFAPIPFKNPYDADLQEFSYRQYEGGKDLQDKVLGHINDSVEVFQGMTAKQVRDRFLGIKYQAFGVPE